MEAWQNFRMLLRDGLVYNGALTPLVPNGYNRRI